MGLEDDEFARGVELLLARGELDSGDGTFVDGGGVPCACVARTGAADDDAAEADWCRGGWSALEPNERRRGGASACLSFLSFFSFMGMMSD